MDEEEKMVTIAASQELNYIVSETISEILMLAFSEEPTKDLIELVKENFENTPDSRMFIGHVCAKMYADGADMELIRKMEQALIDKGIIEKDNEIGQWIIFNFRSFN
jgi:hypothetical protein